MLIISIYSDYPDTECDKCKTIGWCRAEAAGFSSVNPPLCNICFKEVYGMYKSVNAGTTTICKCAEQLGISYELMKERLYNYNYTWYPELCKEETEKRDFEYMDVLYINSISMIMDKKFGMEDKLDHINRVIEAYENFGLSGLTMLHDKILHEYCENIERAR